MEYRLDRLEAAEHDFAHALELDPDDAKAWQMYGTILEEGGRVDEALQAYDRALELDPDNPYAREGRARLLGEDSE